MEYLPVSPQQMKEALATVAGSKFPVTINTADGDIAVCYVRGFADAQSNVVLISATSYSLALKIIEVKSIAALDYAPEHPGGTLRGFKAKWLTRPARI